MACDWTDQRDGDLEKLKTELTTAACKSSGTDGVRNAGRLYQAPDMKYSTEEIFKMTKYYKKTGLLPKDSKSLLIPKSFF